jgi:hypothetical protein
VAGASSPVPQPNEQRLSKTHRVWLLVYEYQKAEGDSAATLLVPGQMSGELHAIRSGFLPALKNRQ